jgi:putative sigma-54 modulation protein
MAYLEAERDQRAPRHQRKGARYVQIRITHRHGNLSEETQEFIRQKAGKLLHIFQRIMMIEVVVDVVAEPKFVEFLVSAEHKHDFVANASAKDILTAVDAVVEKLEKQVRKYKERIQDHKHTPSMGEVTGTPAPDETEG